jgi:hypothetical protein
MILPLRGGEGRGEDGRETKVLQPGKFRRGTIRALKIRLTPRSLDGPTDFQVYVAWQFTFGLEFFHAPGNGFSHR